MTTNYISSKTDIRQWVDAATTGWMERRDDDVDVIVSYIQDDDHPDYGDDWTDYFIALPELCTLVPA